jgi:hypothetical protein
VRRTRSSNHFSAHAAPTMQQRRTGFFFRDRVELNGTGFVATPRLPFIRHILEQLSQRDEEANKTQT